MLAVGVVQGSVWGTIIRKGFDRAASDVFVAQSEALALAQERSRELMLLSANIAHEIKNPLASIRGLGGLLARKAAPGSKEHERLAVLVEEADRMDGILREFLDFSRPLSPLALEAVDPAKVVRRVVEMHRVIAASRGVVIRTRNDFSGVVRCDVRKVSQILINLLQNALDVAPERGEISVQIVDAPEAQGLALEVLDDGPGIASAVRDRLFTPGATTKELGNGLGLTIARAIAEQHGGTLTLENRADGGCR
jgi:signal transduction histidine kinase